MFRRYCLADYTGVYIGKVFCFASAIAYNAHLANTIDCTFN